MGAIKQPRDRDVHTAPVPTIGGLAMYGGLAAGLLVADQIKNLRDGFANTGMVSGLLLAGGLLVVVGVIDDRWGLSPLMKAAGQVAAGGILVATGTQLNWLPLPGGRTFLPTSDQSTVLTILIVVATINAVNFIDGLDGLAAGIVAIAAVSFFLYYYSMTKVIDISSLAAPALASAVLIGMCLGFLPHNFSPASIFMGDTGSMLLGLLLAYAPISSIPSLDPAVLASHINRYPVILPLLLPAALLVIPYADLLLAVVRRTRAGQSPFAPDRKHLHHRLLDIGHSQKTSVLIMYLWAAVFSGSVVWLSLQRTQQPGGTSNNHHGHPVVVFIAITAAAILVLLLMSLPMLRQWGRTTRQDDASVQRAEMDSNAPGLPERGVAASSAFASAALGAVHLGRPSLANPTEFDPTLGTTAEIESALAAATELQPPAAAPEAATGSAELQFVAATAVSRMTPPNARASNGGPLGSYGEPARSWTDSGWSRRDWAHPDWTDPDLTNPDWGRSSQAPTPPPVSTASGNANTDVSEDSAGRGARSIIGTPPPAVTSLGSHAGPIVDGPDPGRQDGRADEI